MLQWFTENAGTLIVSLLLVCMVGGILVHLHREKKRGRSSCGGGCGACPMSGTCHRQK